MANIEKKVEELLTEEINNLGYELYDVEYVKEGKDYYLRIYIDSKNGITLDDCEKVSDNISDLLDEKDFIKDQYFLEVSSPGIERILKKDKHLKDNLESLVQVKLFKGINGKKELEGILTSFNEDEIVLTIENEELLIDRKNVAQIKTLFKW